MSRPLPPYHPCTLVSEVKGHGTNSHETCHNDFIFIRFFIVIWVLWNSTSTGVYILWWTLSQLKRKVDIKLASCGPVAMVTFLHLSICFNDEIGKIIEGYKPGTRWCNLCKMKADEMFKEKTAFQSPTKRKVCILALEKEKTNEGKIKCK